MPGLPETKLFSVDMGKGACCDCGHMAEIQFVITTTNRDAKRLAAEAEKARKSGDKAPEVVCGLCMFNRIALKGLFVSGVLRHTPIKFERVTDDTSCLDCNRPLPYGTKQEIDTRLFWLDKSDKKNKVAKAALEVEDEELEQMRQASAAGSEVQAH